MNDLDKRLLRRLANKTLRERKTYAASYHKRTAVRLASSVLVLLDELELEVTKIDSPAERATRIQDLMSQG